MLPVAVLAAVGIFSLRQDKILAQHEAVERAQAIADDLLPKIWAELTAMKNPAELEHQAFKVDRAGRLIFPPPNLPLDPEPFNLAELDSEQAKLWRLAQTLEANPTEITSAVRAFHDLIDSKPPPPFVAAAHYGLGLLLARAGKFKDAAQMFELLLEKYPDAIGESGLPLAPLARWKLLELVNLGVPTPFLSVNSFCDNVVYEPTPLTPYFLELLSTQPTSATNGIQKWQQLWEEHELSRRLYAAARVRLPPAPFDLATPEPGVSPPTTETGGIRSAAVGGLSERVVVPRFIWFSTSNAWPRDFSAVALPTKLDANWQDRHWLGIRYDDVPSGVGDDMMKTLFYKLRASGRARTRTITLDNETSTINQNRARPIFGPPRRSQNHVTVVFTGPATNLASILEVPLSNHWYVCRLESEIGSAIRALVDDTKQIPEYFGIEIELAGKKLTQSAPDLRAWHYYHYGGKGGGVKKQYGNALATDIPASPVQLGIWRSELATNVLASAIKSEQGTEQLKVNVYLTSPATLFERESTRVFWFGSLIAVSAAAAFMGLIAAWRAFTRQQQLSEMKSNFVSSVSHELRAPIASVRLMAESLERGKIHEPQKQGEYFRFIGQESRRLSALIDNVLDFSRIEQGRKEYEFEPTDLLALTAQTVKLMETYATERQVALELVPNLQPATCNLQLNLDGRAIQQALVNLLDNAIKHSPPGASVTVGLESPTDRSAGFQPAGSRSIPASNARVLQLWVEDRGEGIPPEEHQKIFERFYRLGTELRRETQGVGIGLSIVQHIVEAHGGRVLVRSAVGQGSRFTIELPLRSS